MTRIRAVVLIAAGALAAAPVSAAKSGERAHVEAAERSGDHVVLRWTLTAPDGAPFSALGVFVRLRPEGDSARRIYAQEIAQGRYEARVRVPVDITNHLWIGLSGTTDVYFPVDNEAAALRAFREAARTGESTAVGAFAIAGAAVVLLLALALVRPPNLAAELLGRAQRRRALLALDREDRREGRVAGRATREHRTAALRARRRQVGFGVLEPAPRRAAVETERGPVAEGVAPFLLQPVASRRCHQRLWRASSAIASATARRRSIVRAVSRESSSV